MTSTEIGPDNQNIELFQQGIVSSSVIIILDDENVNASCSGTSVEEVIKGSAAIRYAFTVDCPCEVAGIEEVITENNLYGAGESPSPNLQTTQSSFLPSFQELTLVRLAASQNVVDTRINKRNTRSIINILTNNYKSGTRVRAGIVNRNR